MKTYLEKFENFLSTHRKAVFVMTFITCALLIISRRPEALTNPQFWAEDGKYWYADAYNGNPIGSLFYTYGGYFVVLYRLIASFSLILPFEHVPLFFNMCALFFHLLPLLLINSRRLSYIFRTRTLSLFVSILYVSIPNASEVFLNLSNIQWHLGLAAFLVLIAKDSKKTFWKVFDVFVLIATGLAGPLAILLLPISILLWYKEKSLWQKYKMIILGILSFFQLLSIFFISGYERIGGQPDAHPLKFVKMIVGQIFSGSILGERHVDLFYNHPLLLVAVFVIIMSTFVYVLKNAPLWLKLFNIYGLLLVGSMLMSLRPTKEFDVWLGLTNPGGGQRYWYIPTLIWVANLLWLFFQSKVRYLRYFSAALLIILIFYGIPSDWKLREYADFNFKYHSHLFEQAQSGTQVSIPINPVWYMELKKK